MNRLTLAATAAVIALSGCGFTGVGGFGGIGGFGAAQPQLGPDGKPLPVAYRISASDNAEIPNRILTQVNLLRAQSGMSPVTLNPQLGAAAMAHSRDMSAQNRAWHFGSDGSSPMDRVRRQGYAGNLLGENISETYENEISVLGGWMQTRDTRDVLMDPAARELGMGWFQEPSNKIWWTVVVGG